MNNQQIDNNDEIDLRDLFFTLWGGKIYIILISIISVFLASFYLQSAERKYSVEYNLKPVGETKNSPSFSGWVVSHHLRAFNCQPVQTMILIYLKNS